MVLLSKMWTELLWSLLIKDPKEGRDWDTDVNCKKVLKETSLKFFCGCVTFNPLIPKSDQYLVSPYGITPGPNIKVTRIKEVIISS